MIDKSAFVHPTAIVEEGASIGANAHIGPFCIVGPHVEIGEGTVLKSHVVVNGHTKIGRDNEIYQFASIGEVNQDLKYAGEPTRVEIGDQPHSRKRHHSSWHSPGRWIDEGGQRQLTDDQRAHCARLYGR